MKVSGSKVSPNTLNPKPYLKTEISKQGRKQYQGHVVVPEKSSSLSRQVARYRYFLQLTDCRSQHKGLYVDLQPQLRIGVGIRI